MVGSKSLPLRVAAMEAGFNNLAQDVNFFGNSLVDLTERFAEAAAAAPGPCPFSGS